MAEKPLSVFISYAREDGEHAQKLCSELKSLGVDPWLDRDKLLPGQKWRAEIEFAIRKADFFIALLSFNSVGKRGYVQKELRLGIDILEQVPDSDIFLIPARIDGCEPSHESLRELQWVDLFPNWDDGLKKIKAVLNFRIEATKEPHQGEPGFASLYDIVLIESTKWEGKDSDGDFYVYKFKPGGILRYKSPTGEFENGTWKQTGNLIYMETNNKYSQYKGVISGQIMQGDAQNIVGHKWEWSAERQ